MRCSSRDSPRLIEPASPVRSRDRSLNPSAVLRDRNRADKKSDQDDPDRLVEEVRIDDQHESADEVRHVVMSPGEREVDAADGAEKQSEEEGHATMIMIGDPRH